MLCGGGFTLPLTGLIRPLMLIISPDLILNSYGTRFSSNLCNPHQQASNLTLWVLPLHGSQMNTDMKLRIILRVQVKHSKRCKTYADE